MPEKYHIKTSPVPPRLPRIGKYGVVDWREDCAGCHNCVKRACIYDRHRQEMEYIRNLSDVNALFFDCMGCFSCVQDCTKNLLGMSINPVYERLGNEYWTPDIIRTTWLQAETGKIPVSGAGYGGPFSGAGFDSMWTDMSEIVRPTRDGIHGREYISTSVDIGRKVSYLDFSSDACCNNLPPLVTIPLPVIFDMNPTKFALPDLTNIKAAVAARTGLISIVDSRKWPLPGIDFEQLLPHIAFYLDENTPLPSHDVLKKTRLVEIQDSPDAGDRVKKIKDICPDIVAVVRIELNKNGLDRAIELACCDIEVIHIIADSNGNETGTEHPRFIKDMLRTIHTSLVEDGIRDNITIIAGGGIALPEHVAKSIICGADLVSIDLPLMIALECFFCSRCEPGLACPAKLENIDFDYGTGRMTNLIAAWHGQLIEVMGAMGMREIRRLRGETGRAMFFEELEEETFGKFFGKRKQA
ncbi:MAG: hypothetical protein JXB48_07665 [Candidatus Latescibacteria bacterium]|nr:hypothetical protein [Candidatus Latescibacterota bacterium]